MTSETIIIRQLGSQDYLACWKAMQEFTIARDEQIFDEIWLLEHQSVFTQGQNGKNEHFIKPTTIPIVQVDRGGQVTYHGPGQLVAYTLIDVRRKKLNIRSLVNKLEKSVIDLLSEYNIQSFAKPKAPGIYINQEKICSIGLRIKKGCSYHGLAFNIDMDLNPFTFINPCGFEQLKMTQLSNFVNSININEIGIKLSKILANNLAYNNLIFK